MTENDLVALFLENNIDYLKTGSNEICNPPVMNTDIDYVILCNFNFDLKKYGFIETNSGGEYEVTDFITYRKGKLNVIEVYDIIPWKWATRAAKAMNLLKKEDRITFFRGCLYGEWV